MSKYEFCFKNVKTGKIEKYVFEVKEKWEVEAIKDSFLSSGIYKFVLIEKILV